MIKSLILSLEQKAMRAYERRHSEQGQVAAFERATRRAVDGVSIDLTEEGGQPSFTAALGGMLNVLAGQLAMLPDDRRRQFIARVQAELPHQVESRVALSEQEKQ